LKLIRYISILIIAIIIFPAEKATSQDRGVMNLPSYNNARYHFGFILAVNQMHFTIKMKDGFQNFTYDSLQSPDIYADSLQLLNVTSDPTMGFTVGIVGNLRLGKYFDLRFVPSLAFGERNINYQLKTYDDGTVSLIEIRKNVTSAHIDLPLFIKYRSKRVHNFGAYVLGGVKYTLDLAATRANKKDEEEKEALVKLQKHDILAEVGVGIEFYNAWFKFGIEAKMSYGLSDLLIRDDNVYSGGIESLRSKIWQLSFTFE
jgi:hypothetical protein